LIKTFTKVVETAIEKNNGFLYINNELAEKKLVSFTIAPKKYLGINLAKDLYNENYRILKKEIKEDTRTTMLCSE
jgi:hypothetical protein